ncbi:uncharacterized protein LOC117915796 isoform X1 [Vitis riparia]|uniref:uncharacterized protein LOC117915796 isoform X1 n=2 Tax=Vitis riparia TaxID=96939 RepID=UPI00155A6C71|nr:uncharacterized protein LOC117915796 isoform X1 [Vitis riparia]
MEDMASLWNFQENIEELKQKLLYATIELESARMEANEEMKKNKESIKQLLQLLKVAYQERDEARDQLQKILNKVVPSSPPEFLPLRPQLQPESPLIKPTKANSSITESNSLSETYNPQSHGSPPVDSFFDTVTSPDLSNITLADSSNMAFVNQPFVQEYNGSVPAGLVSSGTAKIDQASAVIDNLVKGKALPQKGNLLQAVMEAGPLLQTLLVAGPLPRWRNPPTLQPFQIPPVSIKGCDTAVNNQKTAANLSNFVQKPLNSSSYVEMSCGSSQMFSSSMLNFASGHNGSCFSTGGLLTSGVNINNQIPTGKRQRFH